MKKTFLFLLLLLQSFSGFSQEKLFKQAIDRGKTSVGCYRVENPKNKDVRQEEMEAFVRSKGYTVLSASSKDVIKFGGSKYILNTLEFISPENYPTYVFHFLNESNIDLNNIQGKGAFYISEEEKVYKKKNSLISVLSGTRTKFTRCNNVLWTGNIINGLIDGKGVGFGIEPGGKFIRIEGTFAKGFPSSEINVKYVVKTNKNSRTVSKNDIQSTKYPAVSRLSYAQNVETDDAQLKKDLISSMEALYQKDVSKIEEIYNKVKGISVSNYDKISQDHFIVDFITLYQTADFDPNHVLPKAQELNDIFYVMDALSFKIADKYYGFSLWSLLTMSYDWDQDKVDNHRSLLSSGIEKADNGKRNSKYGFNNFFSQAAEQLRAKRDKFEKKVSDDMENYNQMVDEERSERRARDAELSKFIDSERSKGPSGKLTSGLFDTYWYYENEGEIRFKAGTDFVKYNVNYYDRKGEKLVGFIITWAPDYIRNNMGKKYYENFKSYKEMTDAILAAKQ